MNANEKAPAANQGDFSKNNPTRLQAHSSAPVEIILSGIENVKRSGSGYRGDCPIGHKTKGSLSIREGDEGQAKIHCFHGCSGLDVLHALGLELWQLYPESMRDYVPLEKLKTLTPKEKRQRQQAAMQCQWSAALSVVEREARIIQIAGNQIAGGIPLDEADGERLDQAVDRIESARLVLRG